MFRCSRVGAYNNAGCPAGEVDKVIYNLVRVCTLANNVSALTELRTARSNSTIHERCTTHNIDGALA